MHDVVLVVVGYLSQVSAGDHHRQCRRRVARIQQVAEMSTCNLTLLTVALQRGSTSPDAHKHTVRVHYLRHDVARLSAQLRFTK